MKPLPPLPLNKGICIHSFKSMAAGARLPGVCILALPVTSCATLGKLINFSVPQFPHLWNERTSLVAQTVKCLSTMPETSVQSLVWEDPLEKEMAMHSSTIGLENPMDREAW